MYHNHPTALLVVSSIAPALTGRVSRGVELKSCDQAASFIARVEIYQSQRHVMLHISVQDFIFRHNKNDF